MIKYKGNGPSTGAVFLFSSKGYLHVRKKYEQYAIINKDEERYKCMIILKGLLRESHPNI